jgi:hypothetical protein
MDTREKLIGARIGMLALADELQNISRACKVAGISRSHFYEIKTAFEKYGRDGLAPAVRRRLRMPNETLPERVQRFPADGDGVPDVLVRPGKPASAARGRVGELGVGFPGPLGALGGRARRRVISRRFFSSPPASTVRTCAANYRLTLTS